MNVWYTDWGLGILPFVNSPRFESFSIRIKTGDSLPTFCPAILDYGCATAVIILPHSLLSVFGRLAATYKLSERFLTIVFVKLLGTKSVNP